ncbi:MAG TPA: hypothetical protein VHA79_09275 [Mycobacteriales bacterium]|nr:hypothetical protein [Mycobacteriales bacterium]
MSGVEITIGTRVADFLRRFSVKVYRDRHPIKVRIEDNPETGTWKLVLREPLPLQQQPSDWGPVQGDPAAIRTWLLDRDAIDYGTTVARLFLKGNASKRVRIRDIRVRVLSRHPAITETLIDSPPQGDQVATLLMYDLDSDEPRAYEGKLFGAKERVGEVPFFHAHSPTLEYDETIEYRIDATTAVSFVEWMLDVEYELDGKVGVIPVHSPRGGWFRTSGGERAEFAQVWWVGAAALGATFREEDPKHWA